ncbi:SufD family Fe-S cluster assembly protein [Paucilactobacillus kaifaensis]|uniref:SufD family Fe-S cluster assembly protein n=1 Tax=Paucilactobacillus kaifaensis TaxID=2559921 RepID=UPI0010F7E1BB|nr:SufD family Fe-S cluster assembly protein [Paucilactobacillus kaifaensis]
MDMEQIAKQIITFSRDNNEPTWLTTKKSLAWSQVKNKLNENELTMLTKTWIESVKLKANVAKQVQPKFDLSKIVKLDLGVALQIYPELLQENLMEKALAWQADSLSALHLALLTSGQFVYVPSGFRAVRPLMINDKNAANNYHILIIVGAGAQVDLVEQINVAAQTGAYLGTEILLGSGAQVNYYQVDQSKSIQHYQAVHAYQAQNSNLKMYLTLFNRGNQNYDVNIDLDGDHSQATVKMVAIADQEQAQKVTTRINNYGQKTNGVIEQNGVAKDKSKIDFHAVGKIFHGAHGAQSNQHSRLLTLSKQSHGQVDPVLLIEENDVEAGHAASIGKIDEDQLYYLQTRGIDRKQAYYLLTKGFLLPVLNEIPNETLKNKAVAQLQQRLQ